mmetsp:Transcript_67350/g.187934  ORF Transcript_67350/g.187934 Transcript_67350/m.187934 type:complete len:200 (-) Transcript_67350:382-981(-)
MSALLAKAAMLSPATPAACANCFAISESWSVSAFCCSAFNIVEWSISSQCLISSLKPSIAAWRPRFETRESGVLQASSLRRWLKSPGAGMLISSGPPSAISMDGASGGSISIVLLLGLIACCSIRANFPAASLVLPLICSRSFCTPCCSIRASFPARSLVLQLVCSKSLCNPLITRPKFSNSWRNSPLCLCQASSSLVL